MRVLIYGGGAVGLGIASCLLKFGYRVDILARQNTVSSLRSHGLVRTGIFGEYHAPASSFACCQSLDDVRENTYDYVLVCTKSFDSLAAARDLSAHSSVFDDGTKIVLFQNGWGNADAFLPLFAKEKVYNARVITGFHRPANHNVEITVHADAIHIGSLFHSNVSSLEGLCEAITKGGIPCMVTAEIAKDLWAKMLYNCALNPLGAILDVPYGALAESAFTRNIMDNIVGEVFDVMTAAGYQTHCKSAEDFLRLFYDKLVPDTAEHKSSTLRDIIAKKRTEIDALNGAVIRLAEKHGFNVPHNLVVYSIIKFIEARRF
jgi:2-dehydropantoate 2-reductase